MERNRERERERERERQTDRAYKVKEHIIQNLQKRKSFSSKKLTFV